MALRLKTATVAMGTNSGSQEARHGSSEWLDRTASNDYNRRDRHRFPRLTQVKK
jgi:hypothetical protein